MMFIDEIERKIKGVDKALRDIETEKNRINERYNEFKKDIDVLNSIRENTTMIEAEIHKVFSPEEIASQRLLREMKKFGG